MNGALAAESKMAWSDKFQYNDAEKKYYESLSKVNLLINFSFFLFWGELFSQIIEILRLRLSFAKFW